MVKPASEPQGHGVSKREARPVRDALAALGVALHKRQLGHNNACCDWRIVTPTMFSLHLDAFGNAAVIHDARGKFVRRYSFCHIALSARGP